MALDECKLDKRSYCNPAAAEWGEGWGGREVSRVRLMKVPCVWWPIIAHKWKMPFLHFCGRQSSGKCLNGQYLKKVRAGVESSADLLGQCLLCGCAF